MFGGSALLGALTKVARVETELKPHQRRVAERIQRQPGLVVVHGLGSGKTLTSIAAQETLGLPATVLVPAALQENYRKEVEKHTKGSKLLRNVMTLQRAARGDAALEEPLLIVDEAHRLRDPEGSTIGSLRKTKAKKRLLLTATPLYNAPEDIAPLINLAAGSRVLPEGRNFAGKYVRKRKDQTFLGALLGRPAKVTKELEPAQRGELRSIFRQWTDYHANQTEGFPEVEREDVTVPMTEDQNVVYRALEGTVPPKLQSKVRAGLPPTKRELSQLNAFLAAGRQVGLSTRGHSVGDRQEPKIDAAHRAFMSDLAENPSHKAVVYSNYLQTGLRPYAERLEASGVPHGIFSGEIPKKRRDQMVRDYNAGKIKALLVSSAGGEGLDLKGTRAIQVLEPHWNLEKVRQVEGRGIRYGSHADLPPEERRVKVQRFLAAKRPHGLKERIGITEPGLSADQYLATMSDEKERLLEQFRELLRPDG